MKVELQEKEFCVNPYALIWSGGHYYLVCNNPKYDNLMHARLIVSTGQKHWIRLRGISERCRITRIFLTLRIM